MKKIINGKRYDTETAERVGSDSYSYPNDFHYWEEELYRKKTGEFFLYGTGGPLSKYREQISLNNWSGGSKIIPLAYAEAQKWAEEHLSGDEYETIFGVVEDLSRTTITLSVSSAAADMLRKYAAKAGKSISEVAEEAIMLVCKDE